jgi:hypothetical protein
MAEAMKMPSSGMLRRAALVRTNVLEERSTSVTLMMEMLRSSEMSVLTRATEHNIPEGGFLRREITLAH